MMDSIFKQLEYIETNAIKGSYLTNDGIFKYNKNMPTFNQKADFLNEGLFKIPRSGDILLSFRIYGNYKYALFYQYDWTGSRKIIYWEGNSKDSIAPFINGIPLLPVGKNIYIEIYDGENIDITCQFALLDEASRKEIMVWRDGDNGIKLEHQNNSLYQVYNMSEWSYSPNILAPFIKSAPV